MGTDDHWIGITYGMENFTMQPFSGTLENHTCIFFKIWINYTVIYKSNYWPFSSEIPDACRSHCLRDQRELSSDSCICHYKGGNGRIAPCPWHQGFHPHNLSRVWCGSGGQCTSLPLPGCPQWSADDLTAQR